jgi:acetyltransferase-like isoleucine patch superfamily enzyme
MLFYIRRGIFVELGYHFRYIRSTPYDCSIGSKTIIEEFNAFNAKSGNIEIGENCWFGIRNIVMGPVEIGNNVSTGPNVSIVGPRHAVKEYERDESEKTIIGNHVWISTGSIIHFNVKIGDNSIIAPGSVVTQKVPPDSYYAGNPARNLTKFFPELLNRK